MDPTPRDQTQIDIKRVSIDSSSLPINDDFNPITTELKKKKVQFSLFRPLKQGRDNSTWVVSLFVVLHIVALAATMIVNDCWRNSHGDCALSPLGKLSFQPLKENPLLGPSASALDTVGALSQDNKIWRLFTSPVLHAGLIHIIINLSCVVFVGIHLEQEFGPLRIGIIYVLSAMIGSSVAALFLADRPSVASSGALFGLIGAMLSGLIRNWNCYKKKFAAFVVILTMLTINLGLGLLPYVNNFSNIGGFISGFLLGFVLLYTPQLEPMAKNKRGLFDYDMKCSVSIRQKFDRPVLRIVSLVLFSLLVAGVVAAVSYGINMKTSCGWCRYLDCVPCKWWSCNNKPMNCENRVSGERLIMTCMGSDEFRVFPFADYSQARIQDMCNLICS